MINSYLLPNLDISYFLNLPEVIKAKEKIDSQVKGSVYFTINLDSSIKSTLYQTLGIDISSIDEIPMRWIKGDTHPHIDKSIRSFDKTYLVYLTDNQGKLIINGNSYPISKGSAYVFSEGLTHETTGTGNVPRLLLGPMSEIGISVGSGISRPGGTTIYFRQNGIDIEYSIDNQSSWISIGNNYPISINNSNTSAGVLKIEFVNDITFNDIGSLGIYKYFICSSEYLQFGSTTLKIDGTRPIITIDTDNYDGLIQNGNESIPGFNHIYVYNLKIEASGRTPQIGAGWFGRKGFGNTALNNFIINCSSTGNLQNGSVGSGGIVGSYAGMGNGSPASSSLYLYGCSSSGNIGENCGGIVGSYSGYNQGSVITEQCWSTGIISNNAGGIFGTYAGGSSDSNPGGRAEANKCYSTGPINDYAGGIFGLLAGTYGIAETQKSYSQGDINSNGGGIFGGSAASDGGITTATNCYSLGTITTSGNGIYGTNKQSGASDTNCYAANGSWNTSSANISLQGTPNPVVGTTWVSTGVNSPYELNLMEYTPYTISIISNTPSLVQTYTETINAGQSSIPAIVPGKSYTILQKNGGVPSSYSTITINNTTGVISTTTGTEGGVYTLYIRNNGSYNITTFILTVSSSSTPSSIVKPIRDNEIIQIYSYDYKIRYILPFPIYNYFRTNFLYSR